jgi:hypothetical protein
VVVEVSLLVLKAQVLDQQLVVMGVSQLEEEWE